MSVERYIPGNPPMPSSDGVRWAYSELVRVGLITGLIIDSALIDNLDDLQDVNAPAPNDGDFLRYETLSGTWVAATSGGAGSVAWDDVTGKPATYPPDAHAHAGEDITSGTVSTARLSVGPGGSQVAAGNHTHADYVSTLGDDTMTGSLYLDLPASGGIVVNTPAGTSGAFAYRVLGFLRANFRWADVNNSQDLVLYDAAGANPQEAFRAFYGGVIRLYHAGVQRFETTSVGGTLTGVWNATTNLAEAGVNLAAKYAAIVHSHLPFTLADNGFVPAPTVSTGRVLSDDGTWVSRAVSGVGAAYVNMRFNASTALTDPGSGKFGFNNADPALATEIRVSETSSAGNDIAFVLDSILVGDYIQVQETGGGMPFTGTYRVASIWTDQGTWRYATVVHFASQDPPIGNNSACQLVLIANPQSRVPQGGNAGDILTKLSSVDYADAWLPPAFALQSALTDLEARVTALENAP